MKRLIMFSMIVSLMVISGFVYAQETEKEVNTGQDFTRPLTRFDIRQKYQDLPAGKDSWTTTLRVDKPVVLGGGWAVGLRADMPFVVSDVTSADNPNSDYQFGASDFLNQAIFIAPQGDKKWTYGLGGQVIWPTASEDQMGTGRYQIAPLVGVKMDLKEISLGSFGALVLRNHIDAGGDSSRAKVNYLVIQPMLNINLPKYSFLTIAPEMRVNWEDNNRWFVPFDITLGKMLNKSTVVSIEYKTPIVDDKYPVYDHEVEVRVGFFF